MDCQSNAKPSEKDHDLPRIRTRDLWIISQHSVWENEKLKNDRSNQMFFWIEFINFRWNQRLLVWFSTVNWKWISFFFLAFFYYHNIRVFSPLSILFIEFLILLSVPKRFTYNNKLEEKKLKNIFFCLLLFHTLKNFSNLCTVGKKNLNLIRKVPSSNLREVMILFKIEH
jgi:hypothetical protein